MKSFEWDQLLRHYHTQYGKAVFTPAELANITGHSLPVLKTALHRLIKNGVIQRYTPGRYGLPGVAQIDELVSCVDIGAYITGLYALHKHNLVTQVPRRIHAFTNRRHNRSRARPTALGNIVFVCVHRPVYARPDGSSVAGPEQSLCDYVYLMRRQGLSVNSQVSFRNLEKLDMGNLKRHVARYPATVGREIDQLLSASVPGLDRP